MKKEDSVAAAMVRVVARMESFILFYKTALSSIFLLFGKKSIKTPRNFS